MTRSFTLSTGGTACRASRWIAIQNKAVTEAHSLYDYSEAGDLYFFRHNGRLYALSQFATLGGPFVGGSPLEFTDTDGKSAFLVAYDATEAYRPYFVEIDADRGACGAVRLYTVDYTEQEG